MTFRLVGLVAAPYTPMHVDGSLNSAVIPEYTEYLLNARCGSVFICGSTGEAYSLSVAERIETADAWVRAVDRRIPVVVHVGHNSLPEAVTLAAHAQSIGADAIAALAPSYYRPKTVDDLIAFLAPIGAAAPKLPFYFYHIPSMTGVTLPVPELLKKGRRRIPNLHGLKFTHNDLAELQEAIGLGEFDVVFGFDEMLLAGLVLGCRGAVGSTYNFAAPIYHDLMAALERGDLAAARDRQRRSVELIRTLYEFGLMRSGKAVMSLIGIECGPVRPPLHPISLAETRALRDSLAGMEGFTRPLRAV